MDLPNLNSANWLLTLDLVAEWQLEKIKTQDLWDRWGLVSLFLWRNKDSTRRREWNWVGFGKICPDLIEGSEKIKRIEAQMYKNFDTFSLVVRAREISGDVFTDQYTLDNDGEYRAVPCRETSLECVCTFLPVLFSLFDQILS